jgi:hypothetical protein
MKLRAESENEWCCLFKKGITANEERLLLYLSDSILQEALFLF